MTRKHLSQWQLVAVVLCAVAVASTGNAQQDTSPTSHSSKTPTRHVAKSAQTTRASHAPQVGDAAGKATGAYAPSREGVAIGPYFTAQPYVIAQPAGGFTDLEFGAVRIDGGKPELVTASKPTFTVMESDGQVILECPHYEDGKVGDCHLLGNGNLDEVVTLFNHAMRDQTEACEANREQLLAKWKKSIDLIIEALNGKPKPVAPTK